jgi:hypothetical protein
MDLQEVGCGCMDWIDLSEDKGEVAGYYVCDNEHSGSINAWNFLTS